VADDEVAAVRKRVSQGDDAPQGIVGVRNDVRDRDKQQPDRLGEVDQPPGFLVRKDLLRIPEIGLNDRGAFLPARIVLLCATATGSMST
jgi:hypothetical protein